VYNHFLRERIDFYESHKDQPKGVKKGLTYHDNAASLTQLKKQSETLWLKEVNSQSLQASLKHLDKAYQRFFKEKKGFPKFKSKHHKQSFIIPQRFVFFSGKKPSKTLLGQEELASTHSWLKIPNLPKSAPLLRVKEHRKIPKGAKILSVTISKTPTGKYFASLACALEIKPLPLPTPPQNKQVKSVGIDLGLTALVICSDGVRFENPRHLKKAIQKLKYTQRQVSKKKKGSNSHNQARLKLASVHEKVANARKDYLHKISSHLTQEQTVICMESLKVKNMVKNHHLAQAISDAAWGELTRQLNYKSGWHRRVVVQIDTYFPSSKTCSCCGHKLDQLPLSVRQWQCPQCDTIHDRDINAALNIEHEGLKILEIPSGCGAQSDTKQKRVEALPLGEPAKPEAPSL
jgi:putative transposase